MTYQETATQIILDSIKSAVFIDENARPFYSIPSEISVYEERLSEELVINFKNNGISLAIHKFNVGDENESKLKKYLFEDRDLVLLDWKLDGQEGEDYSLKLLSDIISRANIHFCVIYTSDPSISNIYSSLLSYFSGKEKTFYTSIKKKFDAYEDDLSEIFKKFNLFNLEANGRLMGDLIRIDEGFIQKLTKETSISNGLLALKHLKIAFENWPKADTIQPEPIYELLSPNQNTLVINNTIISIVNKDKNENAASDAIGIIKKFSDQIAASTNSFAQLLGLEMQLIFSSQSSFVDASLLKVSKEALLKHRKHLIEEDKSDFAFKSLIKDLLIEHANMSLRSAKLSLLDDVLLNNLMEGDLVEPTDPELMAMNVFYNSIRLDRSINLAPPLINFGDVFINEKNEYFICITALCDCIRPDKIKSNYFFAKGISIENDLALRLGDSAFISFISEDIVVSWVSTEADKANDDTFRFKPVYIKPLAYNLKSSKIIANKVEIRRLITKTTNEQIDMGEFDWQILNYVTTIRPNYTQRIANHTFTHPTRVGVDFVKKH